MKRNIKRKMTCPILLGLLLLLIIICVPARAETTASGTFGRSNLEMQWSVEGNTLYITGNGYMDGFSMNASRPWDPYREQIQRVVMTGTIQNIGYHAFEGCTELTEIVWPDGLQYIHDYAFSGCTSLKEVTIPGQVEIIYEFVFNQCTALETVTMSESVRKIYAGAFYECSALHTVTLSPKLEEIGRWCFQGCKSLKQIQLPTTLLLLGSAAFRESGLEKINIPERVQELPGGLFWSCRALEEVTFSGKSLQVLGTQLFKDCDKLTKLHIPASVTTVYVNAFVECDNLEVVCFHGNMPKLHPSYDFTPICLTFCYPEGNATWKPDEFPQDVRNNIQFQPIVCQQPVGPAAHQHTWNSGKVTRAATCAEEGVKTYTCTGCKSTNSERIAKISEHVWDNGKVTKSATCAKEGLKTYTCTICKTTKTEPVAKITQHTWDSGEETKAATCIEEGVKTYTCTICQATRTEQIAKLSEHIWDGGTENTDTTVTYRCTACTTVKTEGTPVTEDTGTDETTEETTEETTKESTTADTTTSGNTSQEQEQAKKSPWVAISVGGAVLLVGGGAGAWFWLQKKRGGFAFKKM